MGVFDFIDDVGEAIEDGIENVVEGAGELIDDGLDLVADGADAIGLDDAAEAIDDFGDTIASATGGDVEEKELGETEDPKELILGKTAEISSTAQTLTDMAAALESTGEALKQIDSANWVGGGADAFNEVYDKQPKLWFDGADAMSDAAQAMTAWHNVVKTAQDKAADAIDEWKAAAREEQRQINWWNSLTAEQQSQTTLIDTWTPMRNNARSILRNARIQRDNGAGIAVTAFAAATDKAPAEPPFSERWLANLSDLGGVLEHGALNFMSGLLTSLTGLVQFVRQINPFDVYNMTHPADYLEGLSNLGTGLVVAAADPGAAVSAILEDARRNPFEFMGALTGDALLTAATGGAGSAKLAVSAVRRIADAGRVGRHLDDLGDVGRHLPSSHTPSPTPDNPPGHADVPPHQAGPAPDTGHTPDTNPMDAGSRPDTDSPGNSRPDEPPAQTDPPRDRDTDDEPQVTGRLPDHAPDDPPTRPDNDPPAQTDPDPAPPQSHTPAPDRNPDPDPPGPADDPDPPLQRTDPRPDAANPTPHPDAPSTTAGDPGTTPAAHNNPSPTTHNDPTPTTHNDPASTTHGDPDRPPATHTDSGPVTEPTPDAPREITPDPGATETLGPRPDSDAPAARTDPGTHTDPGHTPASRPDDDVPAPHPDRDTDAPPANRPEDTDSPAPGTGTEPPGSRTPHDAPGSRPDSDTPGARSGEHQPGARPDSNTPGSDRPGSRDGDGPRDTDTGRDPAADTHRPADDPANTPPAYIAPGTHTGPGSPGLRSDPGPNAPARTPDPDHPPRRPDASSPARHPEPASSRNPAASSPARSPEAAPSRTPDNSPAARPGPATRPDRDTSARPRALDRSSPATRPDHDAGPARNPEPDRPGNRPAAHPDSDTRIPDDRTRPHPANRDTPRTPTHRQADTPDRPARDPDPDHHDPDTPRDHDPDAPTHHDRADSDRDAHDEARRSGAEHNRTPEQKTCSTDPVDISTGEFLLPEIDIELPGVLPLLLRRAHHSNYRYGRWFGPSWSATLDTRIAIGIDGVTFFGADGIMLAYPHAEAGEPVAPLTGGRQWSLTRTDIGGYRVWDRERELTWHFAAEPVLGGLDTALGNYAVSAVTDRHHNRIRFHYDADGVPVEVSHSGGYRVRIETAGGRITGLALLSGPPDAALVTPLRKFTYDAGKLVAVTNAVGATTRYTYDADHRMTSWTDSNGNRMVNTYDAAGRVIHQRGTAGMLDCDFDYLELPGGTGRFTRVTDSRGAVTAHGFDRELQLRDLVTPGGGQFHYDYNIDRKPLVVTGPDRATSTRYIYNAAGDPTTITRPDGTAIDFEYTLPQRPSTITGADGAVHRREWSDTGELTAVLDAAGTRTEFAHDPTGAVTAFSAAGGRTVVHNDAAGLPIRIVDPLGATTEFERDAAGRPVRIVDTAGSVTHYDWSPAGNLLRRTDPDGRHESWTYDGEGNLLTHTDRAGGVTRYTYGVFDLVQSRIDPDGAVTRYDWDTERRLTTVHNPLGQRWTYRYDKAGQLIAETDYSAATTTYTWDSAGRVATVTPATGVTRFRRYDILGRLTEISTGTGEWIRYTYDAAGRVLTAGSGIGDKPAHTIEYAYTAAGLLAAEQLDDREPLRYTYDPHGRRTGRTSPTGTETHWHHDLTGRIDRLDLDGHELTVEYDPRGHRTGWRLGELTVTRAFDTFGRVTGQDVTAFPAPLLSLGLGQDTRPAPRRVRRDEFTYRPDGPLTAHATSRPGTAPTRRAYDVDPAGRVTTVSGNDGPTERYSYDPLGNITSAARIFPTPGSADLPVDPGLPAAPPSEPAAQHEYENNLLVGDGRSHYDYDRAGRLVRKATPHPNRPPDTWHFRYDGFDRLTDVYTPDQRWWHYTYDAHGRRTTKQLLDTTGTVLARTDYIWDDDRLIECTEPGTTTRWEYLPDTHTPVVQTVSRAGAAPEFTAIVTDLVGTPAELINPRTGIVVATATTTLWGRTIWSGTASTPLRFPGQYHDPETGLHYNRHRFYDPDTGRFLTRDPLGLTPAPNPHAYPHNPTIWSDPLGLMPRACDTTETPEHDRPDRDPDTAAPPDPTPTRPTADNDGLPENGNPDAIPGPDTGRPGTDGAPQRNPDAAEEPGKLESGASPGEDPTPDSIRLGTVRMEDHPDFDRIRAELEEAGYPLDIVRDGDPHVERVEIVDRAGNSRVEQRVVGIEGMRFLDLEHEVGHVRQLLERFDGDPPFTERMVENPGRPLKKSNDQSNVITNKQNAVIEFHNRLLEYKWLSERGAPRELLDEHADGLNDWHSAYRDAIRAYKGKKSKVGQWADEHFPDLRDLIEEYRQLGGGFGGM